MASSCSDNKKWQVKMRTLSDSAAFLFDNQTMSDVTFVFNKETSDSTSIHAHSWLLSMLSPVFYESFKDNFEVNKEIPVSDASHTALMECLRFIYTSECLLTCENVFEIMAAAKKYSLEFLENDCVEFISNSITVDSACQYLENSILMKQNSLKENTILFIGRELSSIFNSNFFLSIKKETLEAILTITDTCQFKETEIFTSTMKWAAQQCISNLVAVNGQNKRLMLGDLVKLIRFPTMTPCELALCISQEKGLLTLEEVQELFLDSTINERNNSGFPKEPRKNMFNFEDLEEKYLKIGDVSPKFSNLSISGISSKFSVNRRINLTQIHFSYSDKTTDGTIELLDHNHLIIEKQSFDDRVSEKKIMLIAQQIIFYPNREYTININYNNPTCEFKLCDQKNIPWSNTQNGVEFRFSELSRLLQGLTFKSYD